MTRIIAGLAGSIQLAAAAKATRPTSDRVKESLFQKLEHLELLENAVVLDLFAGTGGLGLEAASRGAQEVQFVERDKQAFELLKANISKVERAIKNTGREIKLFAQHKTADKFVSGCAANFDLVFVDPPYELASSELARLLRQIEKLLAPEGSVILERSSKTKDELPGNYEVLDQKSYGDTAVTLLRLG